MLYTIVVLLVCGCRTDRCIGGALIILPLVVAAVVFVWNLISRPPVTLVDSSALCRIGWAPET